MKYSTVVYLIIFLITVGCGNEGSDSPFSASDSPSQVVEYYIEGLMSYGDDHHKMYDLLSQQTKPTDYDKYSDSIDQMISALSMQGVTYQFIGTENEQINGDQATVLVKYKIIVQGYPSTKKKNVTLIKEGSNWKLAELYDLR